VPQPTLRVLLVTSGQDLIDRVRGALAEYEAAARFDLACVADVASAILALRQGQVGVLLLPLPQPGGGLGVLVTLRAEGPETPLVVISPEAEEPLAMKAVQLGASDYLLEERLFGTVLARALLHAVEVERVRRSLAAREAAWPPSLRPDGVRPAALRSALPESFADLTRQYGELLDRAVEQALYRLEGPLEQHVQRLASLAGELRAGPRDMVDMHATAMRAREVDQGSQRMKVYAAEGRVRLLELMGHLVTYYRDLCMTGGLRGGPPR
jgi:DNA-binding NarL/FixJ family response regulator